MVEKVEELMRGYVKELDSYSLALYDKLPAGKRLRAKLIIKIADESSDSIKLASIVELIHAASLLHDDVIDDATSRRGVDSLNAIYGNKSAIMLGDILYSKGFSELTSFDKKISKTISNAVTMLSVGELLDVKLSEEFSVDEEAYFDMIYKKTAVLIEASAKSAALLIGKDEEAYALYGKNLGIAFQIIDDVLDITQDSKTLGKPSLHDLKEGKMTLPYIYLYENMEEEDRAKLRSLYKKSLNSDEAEWIRLKMREHRAVDRAILLAKELGEEALEAIESDKNQALKEVIKNMIERSF